MPASVCSSLTKVPTQAASSAPAAVLSPTRNRAAQTLHAESRMIAIVPWLRPLSAHRRAAPIAERSLSDRAHRCITFSRRVHLVLCKAELHIAVGVRQCGGVVGVCRADLLCIGAHPSVQGDSCRLGLEVRPPP